MKSEKDSRPLILISNDDGYQAKGINFLADIARWYGDVTVCAPDGARSEPVRAYMHKVSEMVMENGLRLSFPIIFC